MFILLYIANLSLLILEKNVCFLFYFSIFYDKISFIKSNF